MSQKEVKLYDDSVIKLTIKQGTEKERFPVTVGNGAFSKEEDLLNFEKITSVSGALVSGELGYTRDTNRLFVGNISESLSGQQQQTPGGTLTGNKYLGFIDSRNVEDLSDSTPLSLPSLLGSSSIYRSYNFSGDATKQPEITEDKKWQKMPYYNVNYDAYDGDYMYDAYRNALILFDHNITPSNNPSISSGKLSPTMRGKRKTIFESRFSGKTLEGGEQTVNAHTEDMYGDGYVLFYNVIPDGDTLTFANKSFDKNGKDNNEANANNYSYNIIKINRVPARLIMDTLDSSHFSISTGDDKVDGKIQLNSSVVAKLNSLVGNEFGTASGGELVKISKNGDIISLNASSITEDTLDWISKNLSEENITNTVKNILTAESYVTKNEVNTIVAGAINGADADINISVEIPTPNLAGSEASTATTIDLNHLKDLFGYETDDEAKGTYHFLLIGGTGVMTVTHKYISNYEEDGTQKTESVSASTTFGKASEYTEIMIPFMLNLENEALVVSNATKKVIIPQK